MMGKKSKALVHEKHERHEKNQGQIMTEWNSPESAPLDVVFIANVRLPWAVFALWNNPKQKFVYTETQLNYVLGHEDPYFENEYLKSDELVGWLPLPECP